MKTIRILTDSAADYSEADRKRRGIGCIPLPIVFGDGTEAAGDELTHAEFYKKLETAYPHTSQPSPAAFLDCFEAAKQDGDTVIAILLSGALSGTVQSARLAKEIADYAPIYILDSKTATQGMRVLVDRALELRQQGAGAEEIMRELELLRDRIRIYAGLNTLDYLAKGGRIARGAASIGDLISLKPLIRLSQDGAVELIGKQPGMARAYRQLARMVRQEPPDRQYPVSFLYTREPQHSAAFAAYLNRQGMRLGEPELCSVGPAIGGHIGPDAFGIAYVREA